MMYFLDEKMHGCMYEARRAGSCRYNRFVSCSGQQSSADSHRDAAKGNDRIADTKGSDSEKDVKYCSLKFIYDRYMQERLKLSQTLHKKI